jgi:hypothetical protein
MPPFTLGQASKATGRSKAGILDAIRTGRLSATRDDKKQWQIDPAELDRVYPLIVQSGVKTEQDQTPLNTQELRHFEEKISFFERIIDSLENERNDLRERLDKSEDERRSTQSKLTALLTHQPNPEAQTAPIPAGTNPIANQIDRPAIIRPWLWVALILAVALGIWAYLYFRQQ